MEPIKDLYGDYLMRLAQQFPGLDNLLVQGGFVPADQLHDYANAYGPGGQFYDPYLQSQAARASGRQQPPLFAINGAVIAGHGTLRDGVFEWGPQMTAPYTGMPKV